MESLLYFWYFFEYKKSKQFNWKWINEITSCHCMFGPKNIVSKKFASLYWQPSSESFRIHLSGSASLEIPEVTRWASVALRYQAISCVDALIPVPCHVFASSPHLQLVTFISHQFLTKEILGALRIWLVLLALRVLYCVMCQIQSAQGFATFSLGNTCDHGIFPSRDINSHLCC